MSNFLTAAEVARKLDEPFQKIYLAIQSGVIVPDVMTERYYLFAENRLEQLRLLVAGFVTRNSKKGELAR